MASDIGNAPMSFFSGARLAHLRIGIVLLNSSGLLSKTALSHVATSSVLPDSYIQKLLNSAYHFSRSNLDFWDISSSFSRELFIKADFAKQCGH